MSEYPIILTDSRGEIIDRAGNVESAVSVLYGDLSTHDGTARTATLPAGDEYDGWARELAWNADINADCYGIPTDLVVRED